MSDNVLSRLQRADPVATAMSAACCGRIQCWRHRRGSSDDDGFQQADLMIVLFDFVSIFEFVLYSP
uniref:Uncharacterized protein n=1 Tax=Oryza sativa subsp. japonica TaxID=39947 RepID=Q5Z9E3_ORYSJ|nr:hypothetical protein [Oryza sativa Japonica Group]